MAVMIEGEIYGWPSAALKRIRAAEQRLAFKEWDRLQRWNGRLLRRMKWGHSSFGQRRRLRGRLARKNRQIRVGHQIVQRLYYREPV